MESSPTVRTASTIVSITASRMWDTKENFVPGGTKRIGVNGNSLMSNPQIGTATGRVVLIHWTTR